MAGNQSRKIIFFFHNDEDITMKIQSIEATAIATLLLSGGVAMAACVDTTSFAVTSEERQIGWIVTDEQWALY